MNIDICRASKDVFGKYINLLVEKHDQSGMEVSAENDLGIFEEIKEKNE